MADIDPALTSDIHRALEHVIGEVNNAYLENTSVKKGKRSAGDDGGGDDGGQQRKKKKRKGQSEDITPAVGVHPVNEEFVQDADVEKAKKKRKGKGKQVAAEQQQNVPIDPQLAAQNNNQNQTSAAFLNALVTAASATNGPHQAQQMQPYENYHHYQNFAVQPGYGLHQQTHQNMVDQQTMYTNQEPGPSSHFPSDQELLGLAMNENMLRALGEMDLTKIAGLLKGLGDAAAAANTPPNGQGYANYAPNPNEPFSPALMQEMYNRVRGYVPSSSAAILGQKKEKKAKTPTPGAGSSVSAPSVPAAGSNADHAHLLSSKWMNAGKLAEMVKTHGLVYKKGKFSALETSQIKTAIEEYQNNKGLTNEQLNEIIFAKETKNKDNAFWSEITAQVPQRPIIAVYHHVKRTYHPMKMQGKWMPAEDESLKTAVAELGQAWEKISLRVGRMAADCRDRWRNHLVGREVRATGIWSKEEEEELTRIVTEMTVAQGKDQDNDIFWGQVSERMGNKRGRQQCRIKWTDALSKTVKNEGHRPRWSQQDAFILVHKIASMNVHDDSEIDWKLLPDSDWNLWSAHALQRRWFTLKRSVRGYETMTHQEIMDILRLKKAHLPPSPPAPRKNRVSSAAWVPSEGPEDMSQPTQQSAPQEMFAPQLLAEANATIAAPLGMIEETRVEESMAAPSEGAENLTVEETEVVEDMIEADDSSSSSSESGDEDSESSGSD